MKTPLLLALLLAVPLAHADDDTAQCDRAADPLHPGNPSGVRGVEQPPRFDDDNTAWDTLRLACENSYAAHPDTPRYAYQLARLYQARDYNVSAEKYLKTAAAQGDPLAQNAYGNTLNEQGYDGSEWLEKAAAQGFVPAMEALGDHYHDEENSDPDQARDWYQKAAEAGSARAAWKLGDLLQAEQPEQARDWYQKPPRAVNCTPRCASATITATATPPKRAPITKPPPPSAKPKPTTNSPNCCDKASPKPRANTTAKPHSSTTTAPKATPKRPPPSVTSTATAKTCRKT